MTARPPLFNFELQPHPPDELGDPCSWFWQTNGYYWLSVGETELFRYSDAALAADGDPPDGPPYVDDYVVLLWEGALELFPDVLEPIPPDIWQHVRTPELAEAWLKAADDWLERDDSAEDDLTASNTFYRAVGWYDFEMSHSHLRYPPKIWFSRVANQIVVRWDARQLDDEGIQVWSAGTGEYTLSADTFVAEVRSLNARLLSAMRLRVAAILLEHAQAENRLKLDQLVAEHAQRERSMAKAFSWPLVPTDWDAVRRALATLGL